MCLSHVSHYRHVSRVIHHRRVSRVIHYRHVSTAVAIIISVIYKITRNPIKLWTTLHTSNKHSLL